MASLSARCLDDFAGARKECRIGGNDGIASRYTITLKFTELLHQSNCPACSFHVIHCYDAVFAEMFYGREVGFRSDPNRDSRLLRFLKNRHQFFG